MNIPLSTETKTPETVTRFVHFFSACISNYIQNLNERINEKPMPRHHRMGSWQCKGK